MFSAKIDLVAHQFVYCPVDYGTADIQCFLRQFVYCPRPELLHHKICYSVAIGGIFELFSAFCLLTFSFRAGLNRAP